MSDHLYLIAPGTSSSIASEHLLAAIGGKASTLLSLHTAGFNVPELLALRSEFFESWIQQIETRVSLESLMSEIPVSPATRGLLDQVLSELEFSDDQTEALEIATNILSKHASSFAVRSSALSEDSSGRSFAGIYDSFLNIGTADMVDAIKNCFSSAFGESALSHRKSNSTDRSNWQFAAMLQKQIDCDVSGTGFSIHPIFNDYDLSYFEANPGLGTSVVDGSSDPDKIVVNKYSHNIEAYTEGRKQSQARLNKGSGISIEEISTSPDRALTDSQVGELNHLIREVENHLGKPVEIEWGIENGELFLLQARPITRWLPLPESMITAPGERRILYMDRALSDGMTLNKPSSAMGLDITRTLELKLYEKYLGTTIDPKSPKTALLSHTGGRIYANLSIAFLIANSKKLEETVAPVNAQLARIFSSIDIESYKANPRPAYLRMWKLFILPKILFNLRHSLFKMRRWLKNPELARTEYDQDLKRYRLCIGKLEESEQSFQELLTAASALCGKMLARTFMPALLAVQAGANKPLDQLNRSLSSQQAEFLSKIRTGFPDNIIVQMNLALSNIRNEFESAGLSTIDDALAAVKTERLDSSLQQHWDNFIDKFGHRGPGEMDLATPKFGDNPNVLVTQIFKTAKVSTLHADQPNDAWKQSREKACDSLCASLERRRHKRIVRQAHDIYQFLGDIRDSPKHYILLVLNVLRKKLIAQGEQLFQAELLDSPEDIFHLTIKDLMADPASLKSQAHIHRQWYETLLRHVVKFPPVVDSRGYIPSSNLPKEKDSAILQGTPISPGLVTGQVRLWNPDDSKESKKGDILVAYVLDPGSTSQLISATGVILEIGGATQHGAVIAREFGVPGVSSINNATEVLKNGQKVELDGGTGTVRLL